VRIGPHVFAREFGEGNLSEKQGYCPSLFFAVGYLPPLRTRHPGNQLVCMKMTQDSVAPGALFHWIIGQVLFGFKYLFIGDPTYLSPCPQFDCRHIHSGTLSLKMVFLIRGQLSAEPLNLWSRLRK
jgi:hypothetical protein